MENFEVRKATKEDIEASTSVFWENSIENPANKEKAKKGQGVLVCEDYCPNENNLDNCYVAILDGKVIGYANIREGYPEDEVTRSFRQIPTDGVFYINQVAITNSIQSKGLGSKFYEKIFEFFSGKALCAHARNINLQSVGFHVKNGFKLAGIFDPGEDFHGVKNYKSYFMQYGNLGPVVNNTQEYYELSKKIGKSLEKLKGQIK